MLGVDERMSGALSGVLSILALVALFGWMTITQGAVPTVEAAASSGSAPAPMPVISRGAPAYASSGSYPASSGNDGDYSTVWRSVVTPSATSPVWLAYDLNGVPAASRGQVAVRWDNGATTDYYSPAVSYGVPRDYVIEANAAGPGAVPTAGWAALVTVTGNSYTTRAHVVDMTGYGWVRMRVTATRGSSGNTDVIMQMDVHDAHLGVQDAWLMLGDSITDEAFAAHNIDGPAWRGGNYPQLVNVARPERFPLVMDGGNGGTTMAWANANKGALLAGFPGRYVSIGYGTNDANQSGALTQQQIGAYYADLLGVIDDVIAQGKVPVVPHVPWGCANGGWLGTNAQALNDYVSAHLPTDRPQAVRGPDLWAYFKANPGLLHDCIHPTYGTTGTDLNGYEQYQRRYLETMLVAVYDGSGGTPTPTSTSPPLTSTSTPTDTPTPAPTNTATSVPTSTATATSTPIPVGPAAPSGFTAARNGWRIALNWVDNATDEAQFVIERSTDDFSSVVSFEVPSNTTSYRDTTVQAGTTYSYRVVAVGATGLRSGPSNVVTVSTR
jgi:hypothetical protein